MHDTCSCRWHISLFFRQVSQQSKSRMPPSITSAPRLLILWLTDLHTVGLRVGTVVVATEAVRGHVLLLVCVCVLVVVVGGGGGGGGLMNAERWACRFNSLLYMLERTHTMQNAVAVSYCARCVCVCCRSLHEYLSILLSQKIWV